MLKTYIVSAKKDGVKQCGFVVEASSIVRALIKVKEKRPEQCKDCLLSVEIAQGFEGCKGCDDALFADDICPDCGNFAGIN